MEREAANSREGDRKGMAHLFTWWTRTRTAEWANGVYYLPGPGAGGAEAREKLGLGQKQIGGIQV